MKVAQQSPLEAHSPRGLDFDLEDWLLNLVMLNHPEWKREDGSCPKCEKEIERMRERADAVKVLGLPERQNETSPRAQH